MEEDPCPCLRKRNPCPMVPAVLTQLNPGFRGKLASQPAKEHLPGSGVRTSPNRTVLRLGFHTPPMVPPALCQSARVMLSPLEATCHEMALEPVLGMQWRMAEGSLPSPPATCLLPERGRPRAQQAPDCRWWAPITLFFFLHDGDAGETPNQNTGQPGHRKGEGHPAAGVQSWGPAGPEPPGPTWPSGRAGAAQVLFHSPQRTQTSPRGGGQ